MLNIFIRWKWRTTGDSMNGKEAQLEMLIIGRNALITAIMALKIDYDVNDLEDLRDLVNRHIKELKEMINQ